MFKGRISRCLPFMILFVIVACAMGESTWRGASAQAAPPPARTPGPPTPAAGGPSASAGDLQALGDLAEEIFTLAKAGKWKHVEGKLDALKKGEQSLKAIPSEESALLLPRLIKTTSDLEEAVGNRNRTDSMRLANRVTFIEAVIAGPLESHIVTNITLLGYFGREIEIWSEAKNLDRLSNLVVRMHLTWQNLIPQLITDGCGTRQVKRFSEIMKNLELAKAPEEYGRLAVKVSEEVESMEKVCHLRTRPGGK